MRVRWDQVGGLTLARILCFSGVATWDQVEGVFPINYGISVDYYSANKCSRLGPSQRG